MARAATGKKTSTARRGVTAPPRKSAYTVELERAVASTSNELAHMRHENRRDQAGLMLATVYLACALVLVAYVWGRRSR